MSPGSSLGRLLGIGLAFAFAGGSAVAAPGRAENQAATSGTGCRAGKITLSRTGDNVSISSAQCFRRNKAVPTVVHYSYLQSDDGGASCGSSTVGTGASFTLKFAGTYSVGAQFIVTAKDKHLGLQPLLRFRQLTLGHTELRCERLDPARPPEAIDACDYQFDPADTSDTCGSVIRSPNSAYTGLYAYWSSRPIIGGLWSRPSTLGNQTIYAPRFVSPSGNCLQANRVPVDPHITWMDQQVFSTSWKCTDGLLLIPFVSLFYYPPGAHTLGCSFGFKELVLGGRLTQFRLPADASNWGGTLDVVWKLVISSKGRYVGYDFADAVIPLNAAGTVNACPELGRHSPG